MVRPLFSLHPLFSLGISWIVRNFIRKHFTTKQVPAVMLGILKKGLIWGDVLMIRKSPEAHFLFNNNNTYFT